MARKNKPEEMMRKYLEQQNLASWMRCLSNSQERLLNSLYVALRDDCEQGTIYRVYRFLQLYGVKPIVNNQSLRMLIVLSRGSDLAFLFFLLEAHYKTTDKNVYTSNEQLLMTGIMHLDLMFTLRSLDFILPPANKCRRSSKLEDEAQKQMAKESLRKQKRQLAKRRRRDGITQELLRRAAENDLMPYFQKQIRPKERPKRSLTCPLLYRANFTFWKVGEKPKYDVHNEDRWFATYQLNPAGRIVKNQINESIDRLLSLIGQDNTELLATPNLCHFHRSVQETKKLFRDQLKLEARERCWNLIETHAFKDNLQRELILEKFHNEIDWYTQKYKRIAQLQKTPTQMIYTNCGDDCDMCQATVHTLSQKQSMQIIYAERDIQRNKTIGTNQVHTISGPSALIETQKIRVESETCLVNDAAAAAAAEAKDEKGFCDAAILKLKHSKKNNQHIQLSIVDGSRLQNNDHFNANRECKEYIKFFKANTQNVPYSFDYMRIFRATQRGGLDYSSMLRPALIAALRDGIKIEKEPIVVRNFLCHVADSERKTHCRETLNSMLRYASEYALHMIKCKDDADSDDANQIEMQKERIIEEVKTCALRTWKEELREHHPSRLDLLLNMKTQRVGQDGSAMSPIDWDDIEKIDPNDDDLMDRLLIEGLRKLSKDPRFVYATFPEAHKVPVYREWIRRRYGKTYTYDQLMKSFTQSQIILQSVMMLDTAPKIRKWMSMPRKASYTRYREMLDKGRCITERYTALKNTLLMRQSTYCWFAMGGYLVPGGEPKDTFFAYMPAVEGDIYRYAWRGDYRDVGRTYRERMKREAALNIKL